MARPRKECPFTTQEELVDLYWIGNLSLVDIGKRFNKSITSIYYWLIRYNIPIRTRFEGQELYRKYHNIGGLISEGQKNSDIFKVRSAKQREIASIRARDPNSPFRIASKRTQFRKGETMIFTESHLENLRAAVTSDEYRKRKSDESKKRFQDIEHKNWVQKLAALGAHRHPNKPEIKLMNILDEICPSDYIYTGDGKIIIDGMNPDFSNVNGQKKVIELFGIYWHRNDNPETKINRYSRFGYDCLVIWENELSNKEEIVAKIKKFNSR